MKPFYDDGAVQIHHGDSREQMAELPAASIEAVVCDPPYGLSREPDVAEVLRHWLAGDDYQHGGGGFMGRTWDSFVPGPSVWREAFRVLKPGGWLLAFGGTRTYDLLSIAIRMAGFEMRDNVASFGVLAWVTGQGFPKGKTCLKPAWEPVIVARRPGSSVLQIDASRIGHGPGVDLTAQQRQQNRHDGDQNWRLRPGHEQPMYSPSGRWPANVVLVHSENCQPVGVRKVRGSNGVQSPHAFGLINDDGWKPSEYGQPVGYADPDGTETITAWECDEDSCPVFLLDQQSGERPGFSTQRDLKASDTFGGTAYGTGKMLQPGVRVGHNDTGGASRFFYTAKAGRSERVTVDGEQHPTVKPLALMRWLVRLVTPPGGTVLDPFCGSGSTLVAARMEGFRAIGIEADERWCEGSALRLREHEQGQGVLDLSG